MNKYLYLIFYCLILSIATGQAQTYRYIGVENGLSNSRVYAIQKDAKGYMWFLTHDGIDRYNGKDFKHYPLLDDNEEVGSFMNLNWLYLDAQGTLWEVGRKGRVFRYDTAHDRFDLVYKLPDTPQLHKPLPVSYAFVDRNSVVWLCNDQTIHLYNGHTRKATVLTNELKESITAMVQTDSIHFYVGTENGIRYAERRGNTLRALPRKELDQVDIRVNELFYQEASQKLFIGTFQKGLYAYDLHTQQIMQVPTGLTDITINRIRAYNDHEILIATDGAGIYKTDTRSYETTPYIVADYDRPNAMNGNTINDLYIDEEQRIWIANHPIGITVRDGRYSDYQWIKHSIGNPQSLVNDQVNHIIEDSEGDLWFATNNGVSLYKSRTGKWHSFLSAFDKAFHDQNKNNTFISLCEVSPGIIWVGGYTSGIYQIDKKTLSVSYLSPASFKGQLIHPDKYIRAITTDSDGDIWMGGYYNLKRFHYPDKSIQYFPGLNDITYVTQKDANHMWIGTTTGLYLLDKETGQSQAVKLPNGSAYIYSLCQTPDSLLYIGTNNTGLLVYDARKDSVTHLDKHNSSLISNNIFTILYNGERDLVMSTENGLTTFNPLEQKFYNWTKEQGLKAEHFNAASGTLRQNGDLIFGSTDGAIEFSKHMRLPRNYKSKMVFSDLCIFYQTVYPHDKNSPLVTDIDSTQTLRLKYNQNIFSLQVSSINYDYPSLVLYSWKLEGLYDGWSKPSTENTLRFTNLSPGKYTLYVRAISSEDSRVVLEERSMDIIVERPLWLSAWALLLYVLVAIGLAALAIRLILMKKQRKISEEKIRFFVNTAHDIRTPLTLIKTPLEELATHEQLSENGRSNLDTVLKNVNALLRLTTNLLNFERADTYTNVLHVAEYELNAYMEETVNAFRPYAELRHIALTYEAGFAYLNVWMDKEKMESIVKNIVSNALKYTPDGGQVHISATEDKSHWSIEVKDTGIGIPASEQKRLFKVHFRGSNAINAKITGSGIGLLLVSKLVRLHKGKLAFSSTEGKGTCLKITFPKGKSAYKNFLQPGTTTAATSATTPATTPLLQPIATGAPTAGHAKSEDKPTSHAKRAKILIVEDNDDLREYLQRTLSEDYTTQICTNGKQALNIIGGFMPDLILSDIMMPEMRGDELCQHVKENIETSHIPVVLLTALNSDQHIIEGLKTGADEYIVKPFNLGVLRATIANLLANRALLRNKYAHLDLSDAQHDLECLNCSNDLDWKFIATIKQQVEQHMDDPNFNVDMLCTLMNMSRTSFYNKIKALTDQAPADYIRIIKLNRAIQLLKEQKYTITEISEMTGFNDAKYFREVFKKYFKVSPTQYIKDNGTGKQQESKEEK